MTFSELRQANVLRNSFPYGDSWDVAEWAEKLELESRAVVQFFRDNPGQEAFGRFHANAVPSLARVFIIADCVAARFGADMDKAVTKEIESL